ncbi:PilZ domain protein [Citrifermentans bemidjiense Bem]|uniref:PilZ domain protein n=1 Tax=Citrifermentans bemidjiense (strain ATCC BAA-1014 / DSM 16622 / JCM 12645 / Bem) TaxID=404380 RepID=B5E8W6_CITBB|nr:PilZ domain-containing protein [Citrifermentans bemidjiense]ACH40130.1 PilZ domain protein [Citrifermentans bemidjiense Bem]
MYKEKRNFARLALHAKANIHQNDLTLEGEVENLSMKGVFVTVAKKLDLNDAVSVTIYHTLTPQVLCDLKAKVVRITDKGMGLQFEKTLLD